MTLVSKSVLSCWVWINYLICFNIYIFSFGWVEPVYSKLIYMSSALIALIYCAIAVQSPNPSKIQRGFISLCLSAIAVNFALMILYYCVGIDNYKLNFLTFNGVELITACFVLISGNKRGLFKNEQSLY